MKKDSLEELAKAAKNEYYRNYRKKNKDRLKQHQKAYWERQAQKRLAESHGNGQEAK